MFDFIPIRGMGKIEYWARVDLSFIMIDRLENFIFDRVDRIDQLLACLCVCCCIEKKNLNKLKHRKCYLIHTTPTWLLLHIFNGDRLIDHDHL